MDKLKLKATVARGLEDVLVGELNKLGAREVKPGPGVVEFSGNLRLIYNSNLQLRSAMRILMPLFSFKASSEESYYTQIRDYRWEQIFSVENTFSIEVALNSSRFNHSLFMARKAKDAIADRFRELTGSRPSVDTKNPDFRLHIYINQNSCSISLDSSGEPLYKRGYRQKPGPAPLKETLAAGLVLLTGWDGRQVLIDPMCGSGTIAIEAALIALNRAPGIYRNHFGFMNWNNFDRELFQNLVAEARSNERDGDFSIYARDLSNSALSDARQNASNAGVEDLIEFKQVGLSDSQPPEATPGLLLVNPPYNERIKVSEIELFYRAMGDAFKQRYEGYDAWVFSATRQGLKNIGLRPDRSIQLYNGALKSELCLYHITARRKL